ncbi:MAG: hypothetical protein WBE14_24175, partial [Xanthobacteraceae bacterium]
MVRRKINRKYLKVRTNKSNARLTGQRCCPFYAAIDAGKRDSAPGETGADIHVIPFGFRPRPS